MPVVTNRAGLLLTLIIIFSSLSCHVYAQPDPEAQRKAALEVPIADAHYHLIPGLNAQAMKAQMDRNGVRWAGGVGATQPGIEVDSFSLELGSRYSRAGAQAELARIYRTGGVDELQNLNNPIFIALKTALADDFKAGKIQGIGELILNNLRSHPDPTFRRKVPLDAPPIVELIAIANQFGGYVQIHTEPDAGSLAQLERLVVAYPKVAFILSHCMPLSSASDMRSLLNKYQTIYCEVSTRNPVYSKNPQHQASVIHSGRDIDSSWLKLIEEMPGRFMIGSDVHSSTLSYDEIIQVVRGGFLSQLRPETMRQVAYENAVKVLRLDPAAK